MIVHRVVVVELELLVAQLRQDGTRAREGVGIGALAEFDWEGREERELGGWARAVRVGGPVAFSCAVDAGQAGLDGIVTLQTDWAFGRL